MVIILFSTADMVLGMILGMVASPLLMKLIRSLRQKHKVNRLLREAAADMQRQTQ
jgi:uncharacterized membrane protein YccC